MLRTDSSTSGTCERAPERATARSPLHDQNQPSKKEACHSRRHFWPPEGLHAIAQGRRCREEERAKDPRLSAQKGRGTALRALLSVAGR